MKPGWSILIFLTGALAGWGLYGMTGSARPAAPEPAVKAARTPVTPPAITQDPKWAAFGKKARKADWDDVDGMLKEVQPGDRMTALETLAAQSRLDGVGSVIRHLMEKILRQWTDESFDEAWAAAQKCQNPDLRTFMLQSIIERLAEKDPERAVALEAEEKLANPQFRTPAIPMLQTSKFKVGAAEYIESIKRFPLERTGGGSDEEFADDFDFKLAADGITALRKANKGKGPSSFPTNFMHEWAKRDPQAAFDWWAANPTLIFNDLNTVLAGIETNSPGATTALLVEKLQDPAVPRKKLVEELVGIDDEDLMSKVNAIAGALPDARTADTFLRDIFVAKSDGVVEASAFALNSMSSPEARLEALSAMIEKHDSAEMGEVTDEQLAAWGITREQAEEAMAK